MADDSDLIRRLNSHAKELTDIREKWFPKYRELRDYILPSHGYGLDDSDGADQQDGDRVHGKILDNTAENAVSVLAAGLQSGVTSPARPWFKLAVPDPGLMEYEPVKEWLSYVEKAMRDVLSRSNVYKSLHHTYTELSAFSTGAMAALESYDSVIRFRPFTVGEYALAVDAEGRVDTFYRECRMTARQLVNRFGINSVSNTVRAAYNGQRAEAEFVICHLVEPNDARLPLRDKMKRKIRSIYWEKASNENKVLRVGGFDSFPVMAPRWLVVAQQVYGRGPGESVLGDAMMLQQMQEKYLIAVNKAVEPPIAAPPGLKADNINTMPGGITFTDDMDNRGLRPLYQMQLDLNALMTAMRDTRASIREGMFNDLFKMLATLPDHQRTAREIAERHEEKLLMLGPVLERLHGELLDPLISRTFDAMVNADLVPPAPPEIVGQDIKPEYTSMLAQAQRMVGTYGLQETLAIAGQMAQIAGPTVFDAIDLDKAMRHVADIKGVDPTIVRSPEEIAALRERRAQAEQQAAAAEQMSAMAGAAKDLGNAQIDPNTALGVAMGQVRSAS